MIEGLSLDKMKEEIEEVEIKNNILNNQPHMGGSVAPAFDYQNLKSDLTNEFNNENWNDFMLSDIRNVSSEIKIKGMGEGFSDYEIGDVKITQTYMEDTTYTFFKVIYFCEYMEDVVEGLYMMRYYKERGRTEEFINLSDMRPINLYEVINLRKLLKDN